MTVRKTWALGILPGASNPTFPVRGIILQHARIEFYFDIVHVQVSKNPEQWYYISNERKPAGTYMFNRDGRIHAALPGVNYGGDAGLPSVVPALIHERGHNTRSAHSTNPNDLMRPSVTPYGLPTLNDWNNYFRGWPLKAGRPKPWDPGERERWMVNQSLFSAQEFELFNSGEMACGTEPDMIPNAMRERDVETEIIHIDEDETIYEFMKQLYPNMDQ